MPSLRFSPPAIAALDVKTTDEAVRVMQARGIAEADPSLDLEGWDAAAKTAALVNVLMGGRITPHQVLRTGISEVRAADLQEALGRGRRIRLVATARREDRRQRRVQRKTDRGQPQSLRDLDFS